MAGFIEETIASVLSQDYPDIEYIVVDGGSTDSTLEIVRRYQGHLRFVSGKDSGPADAINRGFGMARGSLLGWLNADDTYLPGAVSAAAEFLVRQRDTGGVYGDGYWTDAHGRVIGPYPTREFAAGLLERECFICQPACFFRAEVFRAIGMLNPALQYSFDYDFWIRASARFRFEHLAAALASSRMHSANRTLGQRRRMFEENFTVLKRHYGYVPFPWIHSYCSYLLDRRDQFYEALRPTFTKYLLSLPMGWRHNSRAIRRYTAEWRSAMTGRAFLRLASARWAAALARIGVGRRQTPPAPG